MKIFDIALVRLLQLLILLFLVVATALWYSCALLIPLTLWLALTATLSTALTPTVAALIALLLTAALSIHLTRIPKLLETFLATGVELIKLGDRSIRHLGEIALTIRQKNTLPPNKSAIALKS